MLSQGGALLSPSSNLLNNMTMTAPNPGLPTGSQMTAKEERTGLDYFKNIFIHPNLKIFRSIVLVVNLKMS